MSETSTHFRLQVDACGRYSDRREKWAIEQLYLNLTLTYDVLDVRLRSVKIVKK